MNKIEDRRRNRGLRIFDGFRNVGMKRSIIELLNDL
jgi:hypothetical protein